MLNINLIEIKGYKTINRAKITFTQLNVLIGSNGSGKSNLLSFFNFEKKIGENKLQKHIKSASDLQAIEEFISVSFIFTLILQPWLNKYLSLILVLNTRN